MANLGLLFTRNVSLKLWVETGLFDREKAIYEKELEKNIYQKIYWFTYGSEDEAVYNKLVAEERIDSRIEVVPMPKIFKGRIGYDLYSLLMPIIKKKYMKEIGIIKSNQMDGAWTGLIIRKLYHIPFYFRTGYTNTMFQEKMKGKRDFNFYKFLFLEKIIYKYCDYASVTSIHDKKYVCSTYNIDKEKVNILVNYVDTDVFCNLKYNRKNRLVFVGRLSEQKNLFNIIQAVKCNNIGLDIYGKGPLRKELHDYVSKLDADVCFKGVISNDKMPAMLNSYKYYILASEYEGMPKTLIEAMACGCICIGTNVEGINEVIIDQYNGYLAEGTDSQSIAETIKRAVNNVNNENYRSNALNMISQQYSLETIIRKEIQLIGM